MTDLRKPVTRRTDDTIRDAGRVRRLVVTLYPGDVIGLRPEKTRREERTTLAAVYDLAVRLRVDAERREKKASRKARRA